LSHCNWSFDRYRHCLDLAGRLIGQQGDNFADELSKDGRGSGLITKNGDFMGDEGMLCHMYFHESDFTRGIEPCRVSETVEL